MELQEEPTLFLKGWIKLYPKISILNYLASLVHYFVMTFVFVSVESLQPMLFQNKFGIKPLNAGTENGYILLIDIATKCICAPLVGILSDKFGRRIILQIGIIITSISLCLMGITTNIYPQYCLTRILYAVGAIILATMPFVADYVHEDTKGRASALNVVLAALGAVFSATVITNLLINNMQIYQAYLTVGGTLILIGLLYTLKLKKGAFVMTSHTSKKNVTDADQPILSKCPYQNLKEIYKDEIDYVNYEEEVRILEEVKNQTNCSSALKIALLAGKNIWIFQGYVTNFLGRGDSILLTLSLQIWSQQFVSGDDEETAFKEASIKAQTLSGVAYSVIMVFAIFYGILFERVSKNGLLITMFGLTLIGCTMMNFVEGPTSVMAYLTMVVLGSGMSGLYTAGLFLVNKYAYPTFRGYISGLANVFSVLGILLCAFLGGVLQDRVNKVAPFNMFALMSFLGLCLVVWSYFALYRRQQKL